MTKSTYLFFLLLPCFSLAQTFNGTFNLPIPDDGTVGYYELSVSGLPAQTSDSFGVETACINLTHTWNADLVVSLIAPDGTEAELTSDNGGDTDGYLNTCFNAGAAQGIWEVGWPYTGTFKPEGFMSVFQNGLNPNGTWRLKIRDTYPFADAGELFDWSITFGPNPPTPYPFFSSTLPILKITTSGQVIPNELKINANLQIIDSTGAGGPGQTNFVNDTTTGYDGQIAIEQRGNSSGWMPKKSYNFETQQADGSNLNAALLDMPAENDWALLANYSDKTLMRNFLAQTIFEKMGRYGPRMRHCELVVDGEYRGIYVLGERIKRDSQRVDIAKLDPDENMGEDVTGGYIIKIDWQNGANLGGFSSQFFQINNANNPLYYQFHYPKADEITPAQAGYIESYVDSFERAMKAPFFQDPDLGWRRFASEKSFTDFILLYELSNNVDAYWLSTFLHKDKNGKLKAGPPWDFDLAFNNADYSDGSSTSGWRHDWLANNTDLLPFYWQRIWQDTAFAQQAACRWQELREGALHPDSLSAIIAEKEAQLEGPQVENFSLWDIIGVWVWPNVQPLPQSYAEEIERLQGWVAARAAWMDAHLPAGDCSPVVSAVGEAEGGWSEASIAPNPFSSSFRVNGPGRFDLRLTNSLGVVVWQAFDLKNTATIDVETLPPGCYWLTAVSDGRAWSRLVVKQ
ncbi:MAG: CotH kinase family protein [Saprospiraceae bacterium]|nr:CotH kinase family protein [Saprospiraceae bacterium]